MDIKQQIARCNREEPLKTNKAGAGRKPFKKRTSHYAKIFFTEADYNRLDALKQATGRSLQDLGNTAINEYVDRFGVSSND